MLKQRRDGRNNALLCIIVNLIVKINDNGKTENRGV